MSYFDDQYDAWMDSGCQGDPTEMNPDEYWAEKADRDLQLEEDKEITCQGPWAGTRCPEKAKFVFTGGERKYYRQRGYEDPKRCPDCREAKKQLNQLKK